MKAIQYHETGSIASLKLSELPTPTAGPGEVVIEVKAIGVNPVDWKLIEGRMPQPLPLPAIPGRDVSGVVVQVGPGVTDFAIGDRVFGYNPFNYPGTYADHALAPASALAKMPESMTFEQGAALPVGALTAYQGLFVHGKLEGKHTVLICGAAGGVGSMAVQLAKWKHAEVVATVSKKNHDYLRSLGANELIDYNTTYFENQVRDIELVFDCVGGDTTERAFMTLQSGGRLVTIAGFGLTDIEPDKHYIPMGVEPNGAQLSEIAGLFESGDISVHIEKTFPLAEATSALELSKSGHTRGKILLIP